MTRTEILAEAARLVTQDRAAVYGDARTMHGLIGSYWSSYLGVTIRPHDVAAMMALMKVARGSVRPDHSDSWIDCAAYAALAGEMAGAGQ